MAPLGGGILKNSALHCKDREFHQRFDSFQKVLDPEIGHHLKKTLICASFDKDCKC